MQHSPWYFLSSRNGTYTRGVGVIGGERDTDAMMQKTQVSSKFWAIDSCMDLSCAFCEELAGRGPDDAYATAVKLCSDLDVPGRRAILNGNVWTKGVFSFSSKTRLEAALEDIDNDLAELDDPSPCISAGNASSLASTSVSAEPVSSSRINLSAREEKRSLSRMSQNIAVPS